MPLSRRRLLGTAAVLGLAAGCAGQAPAAPPPAPPPPLDGPGPLIDWIAAHPDQASVLVDDGRGTVVTHLPDQPRPVGSASKVIHLTAYAQAVVAGRLDPDATVPVAEWERWYVPATDAGAHPQAVQALGATPEGTVRWDDLVGVMIDFSDNAVPDLIRATLGDDALVEAAAAAGWTDPDLPSYGGEALIMPGPVPAGTDRRAAAIAAARAYAADPAARTAAAEQAAEWLAEATAAQTDPAVAERLLARLEVQRQWFEDAPTATATQLAGAHRATATGALGPEVSPIIRRHLERGLADKLPAGVLGAGQKGGSLPGLVTNAFTLRRDDGTVAVSVVSLSGLDIQAYGEVLTSGAPVQLSQQALLDSDIADRLAAAAGNR